MQDDATAELDEDATPLEPPSGPFRSAAGTGPHSGPAICQFLAAESDLLDLTQPVPSPDHANRCVALGEPVPQSSRQQELVCLTGSHVNCPRFLRGTLMGSPVSAPPAREPVSRAVLGSALVLVAALAASFGFLAVRGGFDVALVSPDPSQVAVAPTASQAPVPPSSSAPPPSQTPAATVSPSVAPSPTPAPSTPPQSTPPPPTPGPTPRPSSDRFALLTPCPSTPDCWIYVIRAGDNLRSIANYFGVSYERILDMNPSINDPATVRPGFRLRIPTPTR